MLHSEEIDYVGNSKKQSRVSVPMRMLNLFIALFAATIVLFIRPTAVLAESCAEIAGSVAADNGGELLSVTTVNNGGAGSCRITILIRSNDGSPARKKTIVVPK